MPRRATRDEAERLGDGHEGRAEPASAGGGEAEHACDDDVLEDEDREHEIGLVVGEAPEVDQPLDDHRARRDVDAGGKDERREREPERDYTDDQPDALR